MSQILLPHEEAQTVFSGVADLIITSQVYIREFKVNLPVQIVNNKLQVNEKLLEKDRIYSVKHKGQEYFVRLHNGSTEIFQLSD